MHKFYQKTNQFLNYATLLGIIIGVLLVISTTQESFAQEQTIITSLSPELSLEKTVTTLNVPTDNSMSWGFVEGKINNPAKEFPVIIQIFKNNDPIHFAQVNVDDDGTYEYKFRVRTIDDGKIIPIFEGEYTVNIFKVIRNPEWEMI